MSTPNLHGSTRARGRVQQSPQKSASPSQKGKRSSSSSAAAAVAAEIEDVSVVHVQKAYHKTVQYGADSEVLVSDAMRAVAKSIEVSSQNAQNEDLASHRYSGKVQRETGPVLGERVI